MKYKITVYAEIIQSGIHSSVEIKSWIEETDKGSMPGIDLGKVSQFNVLSPNANLNVSIQVLEDEDVEDK